MIPMLSDALVEKLRDIPLQVIDEVFVGDSKNFDMEMKILVGVFVSGSVWLVVYEKQHCLNSDWIVVAQLDRVFVCLL